MSLTSTFFYYFYQPRLWLKVTGKENLLHSFLSYISLLIRINLIMYPEFPVISSLAEFSVHFHEMWCAVGTCWSDVCYIHVILSGWYSRETRCGWCGFKKKLIFAYIWTFMNQFISKLEKVSYQFQLPWPSFRITDVWENGTSALFFFFFFGVKFRADVSKTLNAGAMYWCVDTHTQVIRCNWYSKRTFFVFLYLRLFSTTEHVSHGKAL